MIARQAIVDSHRAVIGYELFNRSRDPSGQTANADVLLVFTAMSHISEDEPAGQKLLFVHCTHESLANDRLALLHPERVVLEIEPLGCLAASESVTRLPILQSLRQRGFKLCFHHTVLESAYATWLPLANFIKLNLTVLRPEQLAVLIPYAVRHAPQAQLIATNVETPQQLDMLHSLGVSMFQGYSFSRPTVFESKLLAPRQTSLIQLMALLRRQANMDELEAVLKKDPGLAFNLLRLINSPSFGATHQITSFRQAVMLMGVNKLFRWAALLLTVSPFGNTPVSLGQTAVVRGRMMELLAFQSMKEDEAELAFVTGIFSMLDAMLGIPMGRALDLIHSPPSVRNALLNHEGAFGELLTLAQACEERSTKPVDSLCNQLQLTSQQINQAHLQALNWSYQLAD